MKTYIVEEWINTFCDKKEIQADFLEYKDGQTLLYKNTVLIASIPNTKFVYLKSQ